ncbi:MAG: LPS-assembly protein LptD [Deltaproteobacteria bacterium]|nr:LPS-assembly protein LptD [Deltaproteobacteria bacterium]
MRFLKTLSICLFALSVLWPAYALSKEAAKEPAKKIFKSKTPIDITADTIAYDKETDTYFANGKVVITQGAVVLMADSVVVDMDLGVATASGSVMVIDEGGNQLLGEALQMDIEEKTAVIPHGRLFFKAQNIHITGDPIKKTGPQTYTARDATFTTCDCGESESPAWRFYAPNADVTVGEFLTGKHGLFYVKDAPVFYFPYFSVPVKRERQSGFLPPKPGFSRLKGAFIDNSFFWAIEKNMDATFYLDLDGARGVGEGAEFRYIRNRTSSGEMNFYHFGENDIDRVREFRKSVDNLSRPQSADNNRWRFSLIHNELLPYGINLRANINIVSDDEYFLDFGKGTDRSLESIESNISLSKSWSVYSLVAQWRVFNNLLTADDSSTLQKLPEITFNGADSKILGSPFYFSLGSSYINFSRTEGITGQRLDMQPRVSLPLNPGGYFDLTPSITPRATLYMANGDPLGRYFDRYLYEAKVDMTTTFVRFFKADIGPVDALRNTIRPKLTYSYIPEAVQSDLPQFDSVDNIAASNSFTYSLNSIVTGRYFQDGAKKYIDYLYLDLSQSFNINEATRKLSSDTDKRRPFSEVTAELRLKPSDYAAITGKAKYDPNYRYFNSYDFGVSLKDKRGDTLSLSNRFVKNGSTTTASDGASVTTDTNYLEAVAKIHLSSTLDLDFLKRFSIEDSKSLETSYSLDYNHQCWSAILTYTEKPEEKIFFVTFSLRGLGKVAGLKGSVPSF